MSLSSDQKKFYENTLSVTKREIQELEGEIQEELAKVKDRLAELQAAQKAAELAPDRRESHLALGTFQDSVSQDFTAALGQYDQGMRLAPGNADLLAATALADAVFGRWETAVAQLRQAERVDPRSVNNQSLLGGALLRLRRY